MKRTVVFAALGVVLTLATAYLPAGAAAAAPQNPPAVVDGSDAEDRIPSRYLDQPVVWSACDELGTECALIKAPMDWSNPGAGVDVTVAISRYSGVAGTNRRLVIGSGVGSGGYGLGMAAWLAEQPGLADHLAVGFDVRGSGASTNISCSGAPSFTTDPRDRDRFNLNLIAYSSRLWNDYCRQQSGQLLDYVTTAQIVRDMNLVRRLLRYPVTDYVGFGTGTWLGAYYQKHFPWAVGRFVLDSSTNFTKNWNVTFEAQPQATQRRFEADFLPWAATHARSFHLGSTPAAVKRFYEKLRADLKARPFVYPSGAVVDANTLDQVLSGLVRSKYYFTSAAAAMGAWRQLWDDSTAGQQPADVQRRIDALPPDVKAALTAAGERPNLPDIHVAVAAFTAITCNDTPWPRGQAYADALSGRLGARYPLTGWGVNQQPCYYWDRPALTMPRPDGGGIGPTLMVHSVNDPATNVSLARDAHAAYARSRLLTVVNEGDHAIYGGDNACVNRRVDAFLSTGALPAHDMVCEGIGIPAPGERAPSVTPPLRRIEELGTAITVAS